MIRIQLISCRKKSFLGLLFKAKASKERLLQYIHSTIKLVVQFKIDLLQMKRGNFKTVVTVVKM